LGLDMPRKQLRGQRQAKNCLGVGYSVGYDLLYETKKGLENILNL
jgi:hypothetical protein